PGSSWTSASTALTGSCAPPGPTPPGSAPPPTPSALAICRTSTEPFAAATAPRRPTSETAAATKPDRPERRRLPLGRGAEDQSRGVLPAGQGGLDRTDIGAGMHRLAGKEDGRIVRPFQCCLRRARAERGVGIGTARKRVVAPVDRACRDEAAAQPI